MTTQEEKIRVNARIPKTLYDFVCSEYDNVSQAINEALEKLRESKTSEMSYNTKDVIQPVIQDLKAVIHPDIQLLTARTEEHKANIEEYKVQVQTLNAEISRLKTILMEAPDPVDLVRFQATNEGLNLVIEEKNRSIERLEKEVNRLDLFSHYFKSNQVKQIEAPAADKKKSLWERVKFW